MRKDTDGRKDWGYMGENQFSKARAKGARGKHSNLYKVGSDMGVQSFCELWEAIICQ